MDNKGAIFVPGGLVYADVDGIPITYKPYGKITAEVFRKKIREAIHYNNATFLYPDGMAVGINLDSGFFQSCRDKSSPIKKRP